MACHQVLEELTKHDLIESLYNILQGNTAVGSIVHKSSLVAAFHSSDKYEVPQYVTPVPRVWQERGYFIASVEGDWL